MPVAVETDFHQWALETAEALQRRDFKSVDWDSVAEELHNLGKSEERELESRLAQLMYHLLKAQYQPEKLTRSWQLTTDEQKASLKELLEDQPSLKARLADQAIWNRVYRKAKALSFNDKLPDSVVLQFPKECPFSPDILDC